MPLLDDRGGHEPEFPSPGLTRRTREFWLQSSVTSPGGSPVVSDGVQVGIATRKLPSRAANLRTRGLLSTCANPRCASGWLHLWRSRSGPIFEGGWSCSAACTAARIESAVRRELEGRSLGGAPVVSQHRHRIPLGLVMLEQGWVTSEQLRKAVEAQRAAGEGRLGDWLIGGQGVSETLVTRALSLQWNCPVLNLDRHDPSMMAVVLPRLFVEAFAALPLRVAAGSILYCGFEDRVDPVLTLAAQRMCGLRVEAGVVCGSLFREAHERLLNSNFPSAELISTVSDAPLVRALTRAVERVRPVESKLIRLHDCLWLRMWRRPQNSALPESSGVEDVIVSLAAD
jgi:hypothetical protein